MKLVWVFGGIGVVNFVLDFFFSVMLKNKNYFLKESILFIRKLFLVFV